MLNTIIKIFKRDKSTNKYNSFEDFFLKSSDDEKKRVFTEVAKKANEDQRELFRQANL